MKKRNWQWITILMILGYWTVSMAQEKSRIDPIGQMRLFYMSTDNDLNLRDYRALAYGGKLGGKVKVYEGFSLTLVGYFSQRSGLLASPAILDAEVGKNARYESTLVDSTRVDREEMALLGEAYLGYQNKKMDLMIGRFLPKTLLINAQDGRMTPTFVQGLWYQQQLPYGFEFKLGVFYKIAPRNTGTFYDIGDSIGIYPQGTSKIDQPLHSKYVGVAGVDWRQSPLFQYSGQVYQVQGIQNSFVNEIQSHIKQGTMLFSLGLLHLYQQNTNPQDHWWNRNTSSAQAYSLYLGFRYKPMDQFKINHQVRLNDQSLFLVELAMTQILDQGKFLFPREWGIEPFYTFLRRERTEGLADSQAFMLSIGGSLAWLNIKALQWRSLNAYVLTPEVTDPLINKYGLASYTQHNMEIKYQADALLKNLSIELLWVYKHALDQDLKPNQLFNKLNMFQTNLMINYRF